MTRHSSENRYSTGKNRYGQGIRLSMSRYEDRSVTLERLTGFLAVLSGIVVSIGVILGLVG